MDMLLFWGMTSGVVGKVLLGLTVMQVHWKIVKEHKIDNQVLSEMRRERNVALLAIIFILVGYIMELIALGYAPLGESGTAAVINLIDGFKQ